MHPVSLESVSVRVRHERTRLNFRRKFNLAQADLQIVFVKKNHRVFHKKNVSSWKLSAVRSAMDGQWGPQFPRLEKTLTLSLASLLRSS